MRKYLSLFIYIFVIFSLFSCRSTTSSLPSEAPNLPTAQVVIITQTPSPLGSLHAGDDNLTPTVIAIPPSAGHGNPETFPPTSSGPLYYEVKEGDTLQRIADSFNISMDDLAVVNNITDPNYISPGQILDIRQPSEADTSPLGSIPNHGKYILVILSTQKTYAYEDGVLIKEFIISSGTASYPTKQGLFAIDRKYLKTRMTGDGYDLPDVPWVMYFYQGYSFHGTYWHSNFGHPMSHGCLNMETKDAEWLYNWAPIGTLVHILP